jgi:hypothetical protein
MSAMIRSSPSMNLKVKSYLLRFIILSCNRCGANAKGYQRMASNGFKVISIITFGHMCVDHFFPERTESIMPPYNI